MDVGNLIKAMKAAGCTDTQILDAIQTMDEERRARGRARVAKHRNNKRNGNVTDVTNVTSVTSASAHIENAGARVVNNPSKIEIKEGKKEEDSAPAAPSPRDELTTVLDGKRADAVVAHRKGLRKPLTAHAAGLLAKQLARWPDPNEAADEMIERGWAGFKPAWMPQQGQGPPGNHHQLTAWQRQAQAFEDLRNERQQQRPDESLAGPVLSLPRTGTDGQ